MIVVEACSAVKDAVLTCDSEHYETSGDRGRLSEVYVFYWLILKDKDKPNPARI